MGLERLQVAFVQMGGTVSALLVVWPEASQHWTLQVVGSGQVLVRKWWASGELMTKATLQNYRHRAFVPALSHSCSLSV